MQVVKEANWTECYWLKQRTEIWTNEIWRNEIWTSETGWRQRLRQKNEIQWSYEGMRGSGIEQYGRTNKANKQTTRHKLWKLKSIYSNSWIETTTPNTAEHLPPPRCWLELHDGTWSNDIFLGQRLSRMSWCRARYLLNWGGRAEKRTNNKTYSRGMRKPKAEFPPRLTQKVSKARFY